MGLLFGVDVAKETENSKFRDMFIELYQAGLSSKESAYIYNDIKHNTFYTEGTAPPPKVQRYMETHKLTDVTKSEIRAQILFIVNVFPRVKAITCLF